MLSSWVSIAYFNNTITVELQFSYKLHTIKGFKTETHQEAMKACLEKKKAEIDAIQEEIVRKW
jgi:adenosine deaminase